MSSSQSCNYDVFLSFRGEDTRKTFVDHLYSTLVDRKIFTYKDDETLPRGVSIGPSLFKAIEGAQISIIIFSKNYADSSWCLEELAYIMKCKDKGGLIVIPIFYDVAPSEVRKQEGEFGKGFAKQETRNIDKVESWRKALVDASDIAGWEPKNIANGHESKAIKEIVDKISDMLFPITSSDDEDLVGIINRVQELEDQLEMGSKDVRMVGIWGVGGSGKTTLASSLCRKISHHFQGSCIVDNIREEVNRHGLKFVQQIIISRLLKREMILQDVEEGKDMIRRLSRSNVLIILDDVDDCKQLEALAGSHSWFGSGSRIIITTRNEHLLLTHKVNLVFQIRLLSDEEAIKLFNKRAYNERSPLKDYNALSKHAVSYCARLPLALTVLGSFLYDKDEKEWMSTLDRLKVSPKKEIVEVLKISYDGLQSDEKDIFLDIACFFRWREVNKAMEIFEACGYYPIIGIKVLQHKALITIVDGKFNMHDLIQEMGHHIARGEHPHNPAKHSRVWKEEEITSMCGGGAIMEEYMTKAVEYDGDPSLFCNILSNMKRLRWLSLTESDVYKMLDLIAKWNGDPSMFRKILSRMKRLNWLCLTQSNNNNVEAPAFLLNDLCYMRMKGFPESSFPDSFRPMKLATLILVKSLQKKLWNGYKHLPQLKVLDLSNMKNLVSTPDFAGLPCLQKLKLSKCERLRSIHPSLGNHMRLEDVAISFCWNIGMLPTIVHMGKLKTLELLQCGHYLEFPEIKSDMKSLEKLSLNLMGIDVVLLAIREGRFTNLISLELTHCHLKKKEANYYTLEHLEEFKLSELIRQLETPAHRSRSLNWLNLMLSQSTRSLQKLSLNDCSLVDGEIPHLIGELSKLRELCLSSNDFSKLDVSLLQLTQLKSLNLHNCQKLVELPELPSSLVRLDVGYCNSLKTTGEFYKNCKWLCQVSSLNTNIITDNDMLLQSMLQGMAIQNNSMLLKVKGFEIVRRFTPSLVRGSRCTIQLPENWCNDYCGFLMCAVVKEIPESFISQSISMTQVTCGIYSEDDMVWEESDDDDYTWVFYVSFAMLRHTPWWNSTYKAISIYNKQINGISRPFESVCSGFGVKLVRTSGPTTIQEDPYLSQYTPEFEISHDPTALKISFPNRHVEFFDFV